VSVYEGSFAKRRAAGLLLPPIDPFSELCSRKTGTKAYAGVVRSWLYIFPGHSISLAAFFVKKMFKKCFFIVCEGFNTFCLLHTCLQASFRAEL
jgi:hypothetical protein